jgi:hypothetical protein
MEAREQLANRSVIVCHRRVWHAHGAGEMSRVWGADWRAEPYGDGGDGAGYADGKRLIGCRSPRVRLVGDVSEVRADIIMMLWRAKSRGLLLCKVMFGKM